MYEARNVVTRVFSSHDKEGMDVLLSLFLAKGVAGAGNATGTTETAPSTQEFAVYHPDKPLTLSKSVSVPHADTRTQSKLHLDLRANAANLNFDFGKKNTDTDTDACSGA